MIPLRCGSFFAALPVARSCLKNVHAPNYQNKPTMHLSIAAGPIGLSFAQVLWHAARLLLKGKIGELHCGDRSQPKPNAKLIM